MRLLGAVVAVIAIGLAACGSGTTKIAAPARVPDGLVPATLTDGLNLSEYAAGRNAFARAGADSLVADGRVWELRRGATLVGALQISTVKPDVSVAKSSDRKAILDGVMQGTAVETIDVDGVRVASSTAADKTLFLWFGPGRFEVLQLKGTKVVPETILRQIIDFQRGRGAPA